MKIRALKSFTTRSLAVGFAGLMGSMPLSAQDAPLAAEAALVQKAEQEQLKRVENSLALTTLLDEAGQLVRVRDYAKARTRYTSIIEQSTGGGLNVEINARAKKELAALSALQAREAEAEKKFGQARNFWQEATTLDPGNPAYTAGLRGVDQKDPPLSRQYPNNSAATPELLEKVTNIQKLLFEGDSFHQSGQYQRAISRYKEILTIDPYHKVARQRIERTEKSKEKAATALRDAQRLKALAEVSEAYATKPVARKQVLAEIQTQSGSQTNLAEVFEKLETIIIPELNFTDVDVADAVKYLTDQSKALDPEKKGINFVLKVNASAPAPAATGNDAQAPAPAPVQRSLSLNLRQVPLIEVLRFITNLTNLQFKVEEYAVFIFPNTETSDVLVVRSFSVPPNFFTVTPRPRGEAGATGAETVEFVTADVKQELEQKGVKFPSGTSAAYLPRSAKLIIRNTLDQINLIGQLLAEQSDVTTQVEVETKFIEFTDDQLKEFGFNYRLAIQSTPNFVSLDRTGFLAGTLFQNDTGVTSETNLRTATALPNNSIDALLNPNAATNTNLFSISGIVAGQGFEMIMRAINSTRGADLMSAPKVTVVNGQKAKIRVVREFIYPTEYDAPEIQTTAVEIGGTSAQFVAVSPANPTDFETRDVGVVLEVKADATKDRRIDLELTPEVTEFQGFINYGQDAREAAVNTAENPEGRLLAEGVALTPVFQVRKVETKIQVIDGQTVIMGGFIRNDKISVNDKVPILGDIPLLGRLFRTKSDRDVKRNLVVFTTARIINPDGTPKFLTESEADALETLVDSGTR
jgi:general secretion pathway protein D